MNEEIKSLLTLIGIIFLSAGLTGAVLCWFVSRNIYTHED
jgi:hypothetical protein